VPASCILSLVVAGCASSVTPRGSDFLVQSVAIATHASTSPSVTYDRSCEKSAISQAAMNECIGRELSQLERQLKSALAAEAHSYGSKSVAAVQSLWVKFRTAECTLEASPNKGGSIQPLVYGTCERDMTVSRIDQVRQVVISRSH
jgi:uncharacterized protein YecT (DUF1311 family)